MLWVGEERLSERWPLGSFASLCLTAVKGGSRQVGADADGVLLVYDSFHAGLEYSKS